MSFRLHPASDEWVSSGYCYDPNTSEPMNVDESWFSPPDWAVGSQVVVAPNYNRSWCGGWFGSPCPSLEERWTEINPSTWAVTRPVPPQGVILKSMSVGAGGLEWAAEGDYLYESTLNLNAHEPTGLAVYQQHLKSKPDLRIDDGVLKRPTLPDDPGNHLWNTLVVQLLAGDMALCGALPMDIQTDGTVQVTSTPSIPQRYTGMQYDWQGSGTITITVGDLTTTVTAP